MYAGGGFYPGGPYAVAQGHRRYTKKKSYKRGARHQRLTLSAGGAPVFTHKGITHELGSTQYGRSWQLADDGQKELRKANKWYGYGDYSTAIALGKKAAPYIGAAVRGLSSMVQRRRAKRFSGLGDYGEAVDNQIMETSENPPLAVNATDDLTGDVLINHREFIGNVSNTGTAFENTTFAINPGLDETFPFLSQLAKNFTMYEFMGLLFEYRPTSGETGVGSNSLGKVIMATNYDPDAQPFTNSVQMENYDYAISSKPSVEQRHGIETKPQQQALRMQYVRTGESSRDKIFTDIGLFQIATEGIPNPGTVGELWVTYQVKVSRAQLFSSAVGGGIGCDFFIMQASSSLVGGTQAMMATNARQNEKYVAPPTILTAAARIGNTIGASVTSAGLDSLLVTMPLGVKSGVYMINFIGAFAQAGTMDAAASHAILHGYFSAGDQLQYPEQSPWTGDTGQIGTRDGAASALVNATGPNIQVIFTCNPTAGNQTAVTLNFSGVGQVNDRYSLSIVQLNGQSLNLEPAP